MRNIKLSVLFAGGISYRCFIVCCNTLFFLVGIKSLPNVFSEISFWTALKYAVGASLTLNIVNTGLYFLFHYFFVMLFRYEKDNQNDSKVSGKSR